MATVEMNSYELRDLITRYIRGLNAELDHPVPSAPMTVEADRIISVCDRMSAWAKEMKASYIAERSERPV